MNDHELDRDRLFGLLAVEWALMDETQLEKLVDESTRGDGESSIPDLISQRARLSDDDRRALNWLVERTLKRNELSAIDKSIESTLDAAPPREQPAFVSTLDEPPQPESTTPVSKSSARTARGSVDRYARKRFHARGGIGQIWLTRDQNLGREVALKELLPERRNVAQYSKRFLVEAKVTGQLEHPGVVPVYDLHEDDSVGVFYTMRFIQGKTLREAVVEFHREKAERKSASLDLANLLNAFIAICNTVEYAHSRGVIHRDLKGQNVVMGEFGEVIVLDWGLAKMLDDPTADDEPSDDGEHSSVDSTRAGAVVGTPSYMSPEQATGQSDRVGTCSDIYSLGVILYELLTGQTPFTSRDLGELLEQVATQPPPPPAHIAAFVPKPLEAVCLKALEKEPNDRYASARELADEVRRYLADEPVVAWPEPLITRIARWGRRHRTTVVTAASILMMAVVGLTAGAILLANANQKINEQKSVAQKNAERANINFQHALNTVNNYFTVISEHRLLNVPGMIPLRDELLQGAQEYYTEFVESDVDNPDLLSKLAYAHFHLAHIRMTMGRDNEARTDLQKALGIHDRLIASGRGDEMGPASYARVVAAVAEIERKQGNHDEAMSHHLKAIEILEEHRTNSPDDEDAQQQLARLYADYSHYLYQTRNLNEAHSTMSSAIRISRELIAARPDRTANELVLAESLAFQAVLYRDMRDAPNAAATFTEAIEIFERIRGEVHNTGQLRTSLSSCLHSYGIFLRMVRQKELAEEMLSKAIELRKAMVLDFPSVPEYRAALGLSYTSLGVLEWEYGELDEALKYYEKAARISQRLAEDFPDVPLYADDLAASHNNMAIVYRQQEEFPKALESYNKCVEARLALLEKTPDAVHTATNLGSCYRNIGRLYQEQGDDVQTLAWQDKSIAQLNQVVARIGDDPRVASHLRRAHWDRAETLLDLRRFAESAAAWKKTADYDNGNEREYILMQRARALALAGDYKQATAEAARLIDSEELDSETKFDAARVYSLAIKAVEDDEDLTPERRTDLTQQFVERALAALALANEAGYFSEEEGLAELEDEPDLDLIRKQEQFKQLVKKVKE